MAFILGALLILVSLFYLDGRWHEHDQYTYHCENGNTLVLSQRHRGKVVPAFYLFKVENIVKGYTPTGEMMMKDNYWWLDFEYADMDYFKMKRDIDGLCDDF